MKAVLSAVAALLFIALATGSAVGADEGAKKVLRIKREDQFCVPNSTFLLDCNECICEIDGLSASCTAMECPDRRRRDVSCKPGTTFKQNCNTCFCGEDGKSVICASIGCSEGNS
ncbi:serine protease inhibitor I/II-like [Schistocerca cancellata]|uniref:serine protease inhibitor I/II-like n=1 Tax=Schistocerca cancellata TaxID=274614 RepID=UPI002118795E|nr:serine protease inhibitor I/II-like [Schistocerca cancellata]